ncbi:MAG: TldD/PmbA family protein [Candidatus Zhuqueibacterota bacterium]
MNREKNELTGLAESLVAYAKKQGADEAEVSLGQGTEFSVDVRNGQIEKLVEAGSKSLAIRIIKDKKTATAGSSDFDAETLHRLVDNAIRRAENSSADPFAGLPEYEKDMAIVDSDKLNIYDPSLAEVKPESKIALAKRLEEICLKDQRITNSYGASFGDYAGLSILVNSNGFSGSYRRTTAGLSVYLQAGQGDEKVEDGWSESNCYFGKLWTPEQIAEMAVHRVTRLIGAKKVKTQNVPVVLEPKMARSILSFLYQCLNGNAIYMKQSFLVGKIGEKIANDFITVVDDGLMPGAPGTRPYDGEGVPVRKNVVVENGVLKTYLTDTYAGRKLDMKSTGNASGANNFYLEKGAFSQQDIIRSVQNGLLLTSTMGQGTNPVTGDFSRGAFGMWIENGEIAYPVAEITISGNLATMLKNIEMIGNDLRFNSSIAGPTIKIAEMTIAGQ